MNNNNPLIDSVEEMLFKVTMDDGSKRIMKFAFTGDAKVNKDECSIDFDYHMHKAVISFNWTAFTLEIITPDDKE